MVAGPAAVTEGARAHLAGRPVVLRPSPRHGCCGGTAQVPVVEAGLDASFGPEGAETAGFEVVEVDGVEVWVDRRLADEANGWTIDLDGLLRWRRLVVRAADPG